MERIKIAICMKEGEYLRRLSACFMNHYRNDMEIHVFTSIEQILATNITEYSACLLSDYDLKLPELSVIPKEKILYLSEEETDVEEENPISRMSKYESVPKIADGLGMIAGNQEREVGSGEGKNKKANWYGIYSLTSPALQLPLVLTLAQILSEKKKVLVIDLQENSGLAKPDVSGMEEIMTMVKTQKYTKGRLISAIDHMQQWDYVLPARNSECLCEGDYELYKSILRILEKEMHYDCIILNFGVRFQGFFQLLSDCRVCFWLGEEEKNWREQAFCDELERRGDGSGFDKLYRIQIPQNLLVSDVPSRLAEQWVWNIPGDFLRTQVNKENICG